MILDPRSPILDHGFAGNRCYTTRTSAIKRTTALYIAASILHDSCYYIQLALRTFHGVIHERIYSYDYYNDMNTAGALHGDYSGLALRARSRASRARSCIALAPLIRLFCMLGHPGHFMVSYMIFWAVYALEKLFASVMETIVFRIKFIKVYIIHCLFPIGSALRKRIVIPVAPIT